MAHRSAPAGLFLITLFFLCLVPPSAAREPNRDRKPSVNDLSMELNALRALHHLRITPEQLKMLKKLVAETSPRAGPRQMAQVSEEVAKTFLQLHAAYADGTDDERISDLEEKLDELLKREAPELDDGVEITDAARQRAAEVLHQLSARQVAGYIAMYGEDFPDPLELLRGALSRVRPLGPKEWKQLREELSEEVGRLVAGLDTNQAGRVGDKVVQLLIQVRALTDDEFKAQRTELENAARQIVGKVGPVEILRHQIEYALAELLSNPRLEAALTLRLK